MCTGSETRGGAFGVGGNVYSPGDNPAVWGHCKELRWRGDVTTEYDRGGGGTE